ncbi:MAG: phenylalanine--tRNA ligase subunit beta [Mycoplasma sp.]
MLVSKKLLSSFNPIFKKISNAEFTNTCNKVGIEVENIFSHYPMENLQIAYIEEVEKHPNADKLNVAKVKLTKDTIVTVVCGAENIKANMYAIYAPVGTSFLDGRVIEERPIRGVESCGMLCGYQELTTIGIENMHVEDSDGIVLLDKAKLGDTAIYKYISNDDVIYDLSIPSNRSDLNAIVLLVNELCFGLEIENTVDLELSKEYKKPIMEIKLNKNIASDFGIIHVSKLPKYEPNWHEKQVLMSSGYKVHNNFLDLISLYTICFGNPIHVYDADSFELKKLAIKAVSKETEFLALDGKTYLVPERSIGIYNGNELINVAGIIGSESTKFDNSKGIYIEVANFNSELIKRTALALKTQTKAQAFFSKPYSPWITQHTFNSICDYLKSKNIKFKYAYNFSKVKGDVITYKTQDMLDFIGIKKINFKKNPYLEKDKYYVHPSRIDINNEFDVFEEALKIVDINKLEAKSPEFSMKETNSILTNSRTLKLKDFLVHNGLLEVKTYNLASNENFNSFNFFDHNHYIKIANPISKRREVLRYSLFDEMLKVIQYNIYRKRESYNIFETQPICVSDKEFINNLSIVFNKPFYSDNITKSMINLNLLSIKSFIKNLALSINQEISFKIIEKDIPEVYSNQIIAIVKNEEIIGYIARVRTTTLKKYDIQKDVYIATINTDVLVNENNDMKLKPISEFPIVQRDHNVEFKITDNIQTKISEVLALENVVHCSVKDVFNKEDTCVYTFVIKISSNKETLSSHQIDKIMEQISNTFKK